jgi:prepilin-type N-terminal cleavage/methylation domain-containing protein
MPVLKRLPQLFNRRRGQPEGAAALAAVEQEGKGIYQIDTEKKRREEAAAPLSNPSSVRNKNHTRLAGWTLTELLCVMAIIAILASLYLGVIVKVFARVVKFLKGF